MSDKDNITAREALSALLNRAAEAELNPFALWKRHVEEKESKPMPASKAAAQKEIEKAKLELERAKAFARLYKLTDGCADQLKGLAEAYSQCGQDDIAMRIMQLIETLKVITRLDS